MFKLLICVCVVLSAAMQAAPSKPDSKSSLQLYAQAAKAIASADPRAAITPLEQLIEDQPTSPLACIAAVHLAECYVASERACDAAALLENWSRRIATASETTKLDANLDAHHLRVWLQASKKLSDDAASIKSLEALTQALESRGEPTEETLNREVLFGSRVELARRLTATGEFELAAKQLGRILDSVTDASSEVQLLAAMIQQQLGDHARAQKLLQSLIESQPPSTSHTLARLELATYAIQDREFEAAAKLLSPIVDAPAQDRGFDESLDCRFRLLWSQIELAQGHANHSLEVLPRDEDLVKLAEPQQIAVRFSRAEAAAQAGKQAIALGELQWLSEYAHKATSEPNWSVTVAVRQCELLLKSKAYTELSAAVTDAKKRFPAFERLHEFDYLLARAAMLQIDFDQARNHLRRITESAAAKDTSAAARAQWMLGESFFLEQNYNAAIAAYKPVTGLLEMQPWQTLALMQTAKCFELLNQSCDALAVYQQIASSAQDEKIRQEATSRMEAIERIGARAIPRPLR